jgi:hypothetical protein
MKLEIKIDKEIIEFCNLNELDVPTFIYDCLGKGYIQNKWGRTPLSDTLNPSPTKKKTTKKKKEENLTIEQKKSEPVKQTPIKDIYGED